MTSFETAQVVEAYRERCEDRIDIISDGDRTLIVVADGAGGTGDGHLAAETVIRETRTNYAAIDNATDWSQFLSQLDFRISSGESTAVIVDIRPDRILGASVGDSCAWIIDGPDITDLTRTRFASRYSAPTRPSPLHFGTDSSMAFFWLVQTGFSTMPSVTE